jgi:sec-independent protein translocase protein TatA
VFGGHLPELIILLVVALVIFGPKRLPEIGGATGKAIREFRKGTTELADDKPAQISTPPPPAEDTSPQKPAEAATPGKPAEPAAATQERDTASQA